MRFCAILLTLFNVFLLSAKGQQNNYFRFQRIEGLSQNTAFNITQDKKGFLWIGTGDGLNRYDGVEFKSYKPSSSNREGYITGRVIRTKVAEDDSDRLWISSEHGIQYLNKRTNRFQYILPFNDSAGFINGSPYPIQQIGENFWFGKTAHGLLSYNLVTKKFRDFPFPGADQDSMKFLGDKTAIDNKGNIWSAQEAGLFSFNVYTHEWTVYFKNRITYDLCLVNETLYIITDNGIILFNIKNHDTREALTGLKKNRIKSIAKDKTGQVWAGDLFGNIYTIDGKTGLLNIIGNINGNNNNIYPVYALYFDASEILWIGTDGMGLLKANIRPPVFFQYPEKEKKENIFIKSIYESETGKIWLGTFGKGILELDKSNNVVRPVAENIFNNKKSAIDVVGFIKEDQFKNIWVSHGEHLYVKKERTRLFSEVNISIKGNRNKLKVTGIDTCKGKWIISTTLGVFFAEIDASLNNIQFLPDSSLGNFSFLFPGGNDEYYFGYYESGLYVKTFRNNSWKIKKPLVSKTGFKCIYPDTARKLYWLGTDKGLMAFNPINQTYRLFTEEDGLGNSYVYSIVASGDGLWLSTNGGLTHVNIVPSQSNDFPGILCRSYKQKDGLQGDEFNTGAFLKGKDGTIYFGGINGLNWFNPASIQPEKSISQIVITQCLVNNSPADTSIASEYLDMLKLGHTKNNLFFRFRGLEFSNPENIQYAYKLQGWDKDWIYSKTINEARYNNINPGDYVFQVMATNEESVWKNKPYSVHISIRPPFWKTWWFYLSELLVFIGIVVLVTKIIAQQKLQKEVEKLERQQAIITERMRISQEMHDDIGAGLTQISLISKSAKLHFLTGSNIENELNDISSTSRQLVDNIGEIIWSLNPQQDKLDMMMIYLREQLNKLAEYSDVVFQINFKDKIPAIDLTNQQRRNILMAVKEVVHNAIKHSEAKKIVVSAVVSQKKLSFTISDDGIGFDTAGSYQGSGLNNIRQRIIEIGGTMELRSTPGKGTEYAFDIPLN
jgi:signal transduction histidine kinase/ligand-binding sensor domain-containing protein